MKENFMSFFFFFLNRELCAREPHVGLNPIHQSRSAENEGETNNQMCNFFGLNRVIQDDAMTNDDDFPSSTPVVSELECHTQSPSD